MTAAELTCQVLDLRNIHFDKNDYWSCWVINEKEEVGESWGTGGDDHTSLVTRQNKVHEEPGVVKLPFKQKKTTFFTGP